MKFPGLLKAALLSMLSGGCMVADQFAERIHSANVNSQRALDLETFLNIVRSSRNQPLTFVAISRVGGQQTENINIGLPTFTLGPFQKPENRLYSFANNSLGASAQGSFDSNPLISSAFQEAIMSPIKSRAVAQLIALYPRELVAFISLSGIRLTNEKKQSFFFENDPSNNYYDNVQNHDVCRSLEPTDPDNSNNEKMVTDAKVALESECSYSQFVHYLRYGIDLGLTADIDLKGSKNSEKIGEQDVSKQTNSVSSPLPPGKLCFDQSLARPPPIIDRNSKKEIQDFRFMSKNLEPNCFTSDPKPTSKAFSFKIKNKQFSIELIFRSPTGIYRYLGGLIAKRNTQSIRIRNAECYKAGYQFCDDMGEEPFVDISDETAACLIDFDANAGYVCDANPKSKNTLLIISILQQLRNISITPNDLNSSFAVRLSP